MLGAFYSVLAGVLVCLQGAFNTRASEKIGLWETTVIVHAVGLVVALAVLYFSGGGGFRQIGQVNPLYLMGGALGVFIVFGVIQGITALGAAHSLAILLIAQLLFATVVDCCGLFGLKEIGLSTYRIVGLVTMVAGILIFGLQSGR